MKKLIVFFLAVLCVQIIFGETKIAVTGTSRDNEDAKLCNEAREDPENKWIVYKEKFHNGVCTEEAEKFLDQKACKIALSKDTIGAWKHYLNKHPDGICSEQIKNKIKIQEALKELIELVKHNKNLMEKTYSRLKEMNSKSKEKKFKEQIRKEMEYVKLEIEKISKQAKEYERMLYSYSMDSRHPTKYWSERSKKTMNWNEAKTYCKNLNQDGYDTWRLPIIDELRILIQNCTTTKLDGFCKVSEKKGHLSFKDKDKNCECPIRRNNGGYYSTLGDTDSIWLWSSSSEDNNTDNAWSVNFGNADVDSKNKKSSNLHVRCVR
ncbi:DUF1566 domain-containing protein [bacterium]|nr:DUF1566 domain-containing protein [bacterium]